MFSTTGVPSRYLSTCSPLVCPKTSTVVRPDIEELQETPWGGIGPPLLSFYGVPEF